MYKGSKKTILVFKGGKDSRIFDEAHFIVKDNISEDENDIVKEANRIISEYGNYSVSHKSKKRAEKGSTFWYIWGLISGISFFCICMILCNLIK